MTKPIQKGSSAISFLEANSRVLSSQIPQMIRSRMRQWSCIGIGLSHLPSQVPPNEMKLGDIRLKTDMLGKFSASLTRGFYDVTVLVRGYDPETHKLVEVRDSETIFQMFWLISSSEPKP